jgi:succinyldiaminopimelate transaminase
MPALRETIAAWLGARFKLAGDDGAGPGAPGIDPETQILPVNGTREALFAFAQAVIDRRRDALVLMPNPFYQIYEGAALLAGATPRYLACEAANGFIPSFDAVDEATWRGCQLLYLCSPGNPTGALIDHATYARLIELAHRYDFVIASDECYSELYLDESDPPLGLLQVAAAIGNTTFSRCIVFHSLSKRSNAPGLRSGFVAGDAELIEAFFAYRTYHGCAMPLPLQHASIAAWRDERHVQENRRLYREKFRAVLEILGDSLPVAPPRASFYLWPRDPDSRHRLRRKAVRRGACDGPAGTLSVAGRRGRRSGDESDPYRTGSAAGRMCGCRTSNSAMFGRALNGARQPVRARSIAHADRQAPEQARFRSFTDRRSIGVSPRHVNMCRGASAMASHRRPVFERSCAHDREGWPPLASSRFRSRNRRPRFQSLSLWEENEL